jgi:phage gp36-like protein
MAYCTVTEVRQEFKSLPVSGTTAIIESTIERFIAEADAEIDGRLGTKFAVPITAEASLPLIRRISIGLVAERIKSVLEMKGPIQAAEQAVKIENSAREARALLKEILEGKIYLSGATASPTHGGIQSYNVDEEIEPVFDKECDQW